MVARQTLRSNTQTFEAGVLSQAITATFALRGTERADTVVFDEVFATHPDMNVRWSQFRAKNPLPNMPTEFTQVMAGIKAFLEPIVKGEAKGKWQFQRRAWAE
jgi:hypothetical protein